MTLELAWLLLIATAVLAYVTLDGFDLGVGILFPTGKNRDEKDQMMNTIAPVWDGNETWLVLGGGGLFAAFPQAYSVLLSAFYTPVIAMLLALVFRGVAFEFRFRTERWKTLWDVAFFGGSVVAAFCQGVMVGAWVQGVDVTDGAYAGGWFDWLSPFTALCGLGVVVGYALLGASWLTLKTDGDVSARTRKLQIPLALTTTLLIGLVSFGTLFESEYIMARWMAFGSFWFLWIIPGATVVAIATFIACVRGSRPGLAFVMALALFVAAFLGLLGSQYPYLIPPSVTFIEAANAKSSLAFMLWGTAFLLPVILAYTAYNYWVFRGKVRLGEGYH